ncbi:hypothetical protein CIB48_g6814 [Xylaria polymorpha]|nr:hypothetical protein CIB48_g6814 [Xylaria polymorpha]
MESNNMPPRQSIDSTRSTSPLIQGLVSQTPLHYPQSHRNDKGRDAAKYIKISTVVLACRVIALIFGFAAGINFARLGASWVEMILLIIVTWVSAAWNAVPLFSLTFRISLVLGDGKVIGFGRQSNGEGDHPRRRRLSVFLVDLFLFAAVFSLNVANTCRGRWYYRTALALNWVPLAFHLNVVLLTISPVLAGARIRFENVKTPQISLP